MLNRRPAAEPSLLVALWWIFLAACAVLMLLGGVNLIYNLLKSSDDPRPTPTVTVTETLGPSPLATNIPGNIIDDELDGVPTPTVCTDADIRGAIPRDRWTPCGQILGYFDDWTTPPTGAPAVP